MPTMMAGGYMGQPGFGMDPNAQGGYQQFGGEQQHHGSGGRGGFGGRGGYGGRGGNQGGNNQGRFKTALCRHFEQHGKCQLEERCSFAHGQAELRQSVSKLINRRLFFFLLDL